MNQKEIPPKPPQQNRFGAIILGAIIIFILYLIFGDEDRATLNMVRVAIRSILKAL